MNRITFSRLGGPKIALRRGYKRACAAVARKLAVIMHAMWCDGTEFRFKHQPTDHGVNGSRKRIGVAA